jgi:FSR family fosmidomycin resistance protein-like MFS transporter
MSAEGTGAADAVETEQFQTGRVLTISAGHAVHDTYTAFLPPLLPAFIENLALSTTEAGLLSAFMRAPSLLQPFIGHLADRVSLRYLVILAPAVSATVMSLLGVAPAYLVLVLLLMVAGLSSAILHAVAPVMAGRLSGKNLGRGMGFWMVGGELGRTLGPLAIAAYFEIRPDSLASTPLLMIGGWLSTAFLYLRLKDVPGRPPSAQESRPWRQALRAMGPFLVPLVGIIVARSFMSAALTTYLPVFLTEEGASLSFASLSLSVLEAAGVLGALLGGSLSDRLGRRLILLLSLVTTPLLMFAFMATTGWGQVPVLLLLGFSSLSVTPVVMALVQESYPENRALANGVYMALGFAIRSGVIVVVGAMADLWGMRLAFLISAVITLMGLPFLPLFPSRRNQ